MGAALKRPFMMYNIEARAAKAIEKSKTVPNPAPRYPTEAAIEARNKTSLNRDTSFVHDKHADLDERLKHVYVESKGNNPVIKTKRKLPENRRKVENPEYGYLEPIIIPDGKIPLRLAIEMIQLYKDDPVVNTAQVLSIKYKLDLEKTYHILEYFQAFNWKLPRAEDVIGRPHALLREGRLKRAQKRIDAAQKVMDDYESRRIKQQNLLEDNKSKPKS